MFQAKIGSKWDEEKNERLKSGDKKKPLMRIHSNKNDGFQWIHQQQTEISLISKKTWDGFYQ